jgi:phospholipid-transporting ATPase
MARDSTFGGVNSPNKLLYGFSVILFWGDLKLSHGLDSGHWFWGTTLYLAVLLTVLGKAALISEYVPFASIALGMLTFIFY